MVFFDSILNKTGFETFEILGKSILFFERVVKIKNLKANSLTDFYWSKLTIQNLTSYYTKV